MSHSNNEHWSIGFHKKEIGKTLRWGCIGGFFISLLNFPFRIVLVGDIPNNLNKFLSFFDDNFIIFTFIAIVIVPVYEELIFRGWLYRSLRNKYGIMIAFLGSTFFFVIAHSVNSNILITTISSLILTLLFEKTKSIGVIIIAHILWHLTWYSSIYYVHFLR